MLKKANQLHRLRIEMIADIDTLPVDSAYVTEWTRIGEHEPLRFLPLTTSYPYVVDQVIETSPARKQVAVNIERDATAIRQQQQRVYAQHDTPIVVNSNTKIVARVFDTAAFLCGCGCCASQPTPSIAGPGEDGGYLGYESGNIEGDDSEEEFDRNSFMLGGVLGVKYFVSEKTTIFVEYRLGWRSEDEWELDSDSHITIEDDSLTHTLLFGISVLF